MNSETIDLPHGYKAVVATDDCPSNPFEDWDCNPPMAVYYDRGITHPGHRAKHEPVTLRDLFDLIPAEAMGDERKRLQFIRAAGISESKLAEAIEYRNPAELELETNPEEWHETIRELLPEAPGYYGSVSEYFDAMEAAAGLAGIACHRATSRGYSQSDWAEVFIAATPAWIKETGIAPENIAAALEGSFDTYTAWAWGDCYGVSEILRPNGEEVEDGSCWGFYGREHEESGLMEHCTSMVDYDRKQRAKAATERRAYLRRERAAAMDAACRDIATV